MDTYASNRRITVSVVLIVRERNLLIGVFRLLRFARNDKETLAMTKRQF